MYREGVWNYVIMKSLYSHSSKGESSRPCARSTNIRTDCTKMAWLICFLSPQTSSGVILWMYPNIGWWEVREESATRDSQCPETHWSPKWSVYEYRWWRAFASTHVSRRHYVSWFIQWTVINSSNISKICVDITVYLYLSYSSYMFVYTCGSTVVYRGRKKDPWYSLLIMYYISAIC